jgi:hypothetical protein
MICAHEAGYEAPKAMNRCITVCPSGCNQAAVDAVGIDARPLVS